MSPIINDEFVSNDECPRTNIGHIFAKGCRKEMDPSEAMSHSHTKECDSKPEICIYCDYEN